MPGRLHALSTSAGTWAKGRATSRLVHGEHSLHVHGGHPQPKCAGAALSYCWQTKEEMSGSKQRLPASLKLTEAPAPGSLPLIFLEGKRATSLPSWKLVHLGSAGSTAYGGQQGCL